MTVTPFSTMVSPGLRHFDVAAALRRQIDDHRTAAHDVHHVARHQDGSFSARNGGRGDHHVLFLEDRSHLLALAANLFLGSARA